MKNYEQICMIFINQKFLQKLSPQKPFLNKARLSNLVNKLKKYWETIIKGPGKYWKYVMKVQQKYLERIVIIM